MISETVFSQTSRILSHDGFAVVMENPDTHHKSLHSDRAYRANEVICTFSDRGVFTEPARLTIQTGDNQHILLSPEFLQYANHSCSPNIFFDTATREVICLEDIDPGDELTFFYPSSEWDMASPFACHCQSTNCLHRIQGAAHLSDQVIMHYRVTDFIQQKLRQRAESSLPQAAC